MKPEHLTISVQAPDVRVGDLYKGRLVQVLHIDARYLKVSFETYGAASNTYKMEGPFSWHAKIPIVRPDDKYDPFEGL